MKDKEKIAYMEMAYIVSKLSSCKRRQVGSVIVTTNNYIVIGFNGTPPNWDNCCEDGNGFTLPYVIHAEHNALKKLEYMPEELIGSSVFVSYCPCIDCAKKLAEANIKELFYSVMPTRQEEIDFLKTCGFKSYYLPLIDRAY